MTKWMVEIATSHRTLPRNDGFGMGMINQAPTKEYKMEVHNVLCPIFI
ncbi:MAG: hypothetical protein ACOX6A_06075 [Atribacter sp.]|nr:hypothetical protein [Atribacterota bacterium]HHT09106.1 hypothetical protein [Candidatus Atribacteria bacterium]